jgi:hypothetical protein
MLIVEDKPILNKKYYTNRMEHQKLFTVLGWVVFASLGLAIVRQLAEQKTIDDYFFFGASDSAEAFANPATANLNVREPYVLLDNVLVREKSENLTAKSCYEKDFMAQTEKTGNFIQRTNNYRHALPDSCSAPLTEFVNSIY